MNTVTLDTPELYRRASAEFATRVHTIGNRWSAPTPCAGWDVRTLIHHIVEEQRWAPPLLHGATIAEVGDRLSGDLLDGDPLQAFHQAAAAATVAVAAEGAMDRIVHLSAGDVPGREYAMQLAADHLIHAWDLARALSVDTRLDPAAVAAVRTWFEDREDTYRAAGVIGPRTRVPEHAGPQEDLITMFGRTP